jgi:hypothetical protein
VDHLIIVSEWSVFYKIKIIPVLTTITNLYATVSALIARPLDTPISRDRQTCVQLRNMIQQEVCLFLENVYVYGSNLLGGSSTASKII